MSNKGSAILWQLVGIFLIGMTLCGCAPRRMIPLPQEAPEDYASDEIQEQGPAIPSQPGSNPRGALDTRCKRRVITEAELMKLAQADPELDLTDCMEILARLNSRARYYIRDDIKAKKPLKVPNNFKAYKDWTPLPRSLPGVAKTAKYILVVKNIPFLGWYDHGRLLGDSQVCIGKKLTWTKAGRYSVLQKDANHFSSSYPNAFGQPTPMPLALRIYERVWIHAGDVVGGYGSHGCINLPLENAEELYRWAGVGTPVVVVESLKELAVPLKPPAKPVRAG